MMAKSTKFQESDPGYYDALISDQKKKTKKDPMNPVEWIELGRLQEEKKELTAIFVERRFFIKWLPVFTMVLFAVFLYAVYQSYLYHVSLWIEIPIVLLCLGVIFLTMRTRYPVSGIRYFERALKIDPSNADTHLHLGMSFLRQFNKEKAYTHLEKACELGAGQKIEKQLKTIYQKEFLQFFNRKNAKENELKRTISPLEDEITRLNKQVKQLEDQNIVVSKKAQTTKARVTQTLKQARADMEHQMTALQSDYEMQIHCLEQAKEQEESQKEAALKKNIDLNLQILEAKARTTQQSFDQAMTQVKLSMGFDAWDTLTQEAQAYLATAEHAFNMLDKTSKKTDFSLVGMELCKALEREINHKLVVPFINNLKEKQHQFLQINKTGEVNGLPTYYTMLAKAVDKQHYPEVTTLTLGQYLFVLKKTLEGEVALDDYGTFLEHLSESSQVIIGRRFLQKLRIVTHGYRNAIVHYTHMDVEQCRNLREIIFTKEDSLLMDCCRIKRSKMEC